MVSPNTYSLNRGITLIEVMVVMAIIGVLISFGLVVNFESYRKYYFRSEVTTLVSVLERARSRSLNNYFETTHGVCYISPNYIIFRGTTCSSGLPANETVSANNAIASASNFSSSFGTIIFTQLSGASASTTIHVTDGISATDITINNEGAIAW